MSSPTTYNFHDLFAVEVAHRGLDAMMREELGIFIADVDPVDLRVEEGDVPHLSRSLSGGYAFDESTFVVETRYGRVQLGDGLIRAGPVFPYELLRWVTFAMRKALLKRDVSALHAAAVARDGRAFVFPAWARTGKTNLQLNLLAHGNEYMADDWCPVSRSGEVLAYPRSVNLFEYNFACHPNLVDALGNGRKGRSLRRRLALTTWSRSLDGQSWLTRRLQRWVQDRFFVYARAQVSQLVPGCETRLRAPLAEVCLLNTQTGESSISEVSPEYAARKVALSNHFERFPFTESEVAMEYAGLRPVEEDSISREEQLLSGVFRRTRCRSLTLPPYASGEEIDRARRLWEGA